jgi:HPt (histidine-containing phosphotransfer) domain-containing protein
LSVDDTVVSPAINMVFIESLRGIDAFGGLGLARDLFMAFLETAGPGLSLVQQAISSGNMVELSKSAHMLKSSAANVGAKLLSDGYRELEKCGREGRIEPARTLLPQVQHEHQRVVAEIDQLMMEIA